MHTPCMQAPRSHREPPRADGKPSPVGWDVMSALRKHVESLPKDRFHVHLGRVGASQVGHYKSA